MPIAAAAASSGSVVMKRNGPASGFVLVSLFAPGVFSSVEMTSNWSRCGAGVFRIQVRQEMTARESRFVGQPRPVAPPLFRLAEYTMGVLA